MNPDLVAPCHHLLPRWMVCERHDDVYRDWRMHDACEVRFATPEEVAEKRVGAGGTDRESAS